MGERPLMGRSLGRLSSAAAIAAVLASAVWGGGSTGAAAADVTASTLSASPNIVLILTDDQSPGMFGAMPLIQESIVDQGVTFTNGIAPTPLCCPARAALLSGTYSRTNGVWTNEPPLGGWPAFSWLESQTVATALDAAGYQTGFFGKYLNEWARQSDVVVPAGWDSFAAMRGPSGGSGAYYKYDILGTSPTEAFGTSPDDYSTDVLAAQASDFVAATDPSEPLFVMYAPYGPHAPSTSAPRHIGLWPAAPVPATANEADMSDKPAFMQDLAPIPRKELRRMIRKQHETLLSVDEGIQQIVDAIGPDRAANTLFVFLSDNALMNGDHRLLGKYVPYQGATEIPIVMRWDGVITAGRADSRVFTIQDVTETIVEAAGATLPTEGVGYFSGTRDGTVVEGVQTSKAGFTRPAYCGWRTEQYLYVRYSNGAGEELYDYAVDPDELNNRATDPAYADALARLKEIARVECDPGPPGFLWDAEPATP